MSSKLVGISLSNFSKILEMVLSHFPDLSLVCMGDIFQRFILPEITKNNHSFIQLISSVDGENVPNHPEIAIIYPSSMKANVFFSMFNTFCDSSPQIKSKYFWIDIFCAEASIFRYSDKQHSYWANYVTYWCDIVCEKVFFVEKWNSIDIIKSIQSFYILFGIQSHDIVDIYMEPNQYNTFYKYTLENSLSPWKISSQITDYDQTFVGSNEFHHRIVSNSNCTWNSIQTIIEKVFNDWYHLQIQQDKLFIQKLLILENDLNLGLKLLRHAFKPLTTTAIDESTLSMDTELEDIELTQFAKLNTISLIDKDKCCFHGIRRCLETYQHMKSLLQTSFVIDELQQQSTTTITATPTTTMTPPNITTTPQFALRKQHNHHRPFYIQSLKKLVLLACEYPQLAITLSSLPFLFVKEQMSIVIELYQQCILYYGHNHLETINTILYVGIYNHHNSDFIEAEHYFELVYQYYNQQQQQQLISNKLEKNDDYDHFLYYAGSFYYDLGKYIICEELLQKYYQKYKKLFQLQETSTITTSSKNRIYQEKYEKYLTIILKLANLYNVERKFTQAKEYYEVYLTMMRHNLSLSIP
jgi:hypothetical protein